MLTDNDDICTFCIENACPIKAKKSCTKIKESSEKAAMLDAESEDEMCWICWENQEDEPLFRSPCACKTFVHLTCMFEWKGLKMMKSLTRGFTSRDEYPFPKTACDVCCEDTSSTFGTIVFHIIREVCLLTDHTDETSALSTCKELILEYVFSDAFERA